MAVSATIVLLLFLPDELRRERRRLTQVPAGMGDAPQVVNGDKGGMRCKGPVQKGYTAAAPMGAVGAAPSYVTPPHVVLLHINPGETIFFQMGDQMQFVQGAWLLQWRRAFPGGH